MTLITKYYSSIEKRNLTLKEILSIESQFKDNKPILEYLNKNKIVSLKPNKKELINFSKEVIKYIDNDNSINKEDIQYQKKFWSIYNNYDNHCLKLKLNSEDIDLVISPDFLKENKWFLK